MPEYCRRLIEVDLPIKRISAHARREKSIRHGHISTMHIWWARRPLAACRAVICAALWPDPADERCPDAFRKVAKKEMLNWAREHLKLASEESSKRFIGIQKKPGRLDNLTELRTALLDFIADFANWDNSVVSEYLATSRALTKSAHKALGGAADGRSLVLDPFAGGGSIPLEVLRVGADAFASDLNPVAVLLNKVLLEYVPRYGSRLGDEVRKWGNWIAGQLERETGRFYSKTKEGRPVDAYIWARTILSEAPSEGELPVEVPLLRSMLLLKKRDRLRALRWVRDGRGQAKTEVTSVTYADGKTVKVRRPLIEVFQPRSLAEVEEGTSSGGAATCPVSGYTTSVEGVRRQLTVRRGGAYDARLVCVVASSANKAGRVYLDPGASDLKIAAEAAEQLKHRVAQHKGHESLIPDGRLNHLRGFFNVVLYGMTTWGDLFSQRQALGLASLVELVHGAAVDEEDRDFQTAIRTCLALALDRCADKCASLVVWDNTRDMATHVFGRQALPMIWDFAEVNLLSDNGWTGAVEWVARVIDATQHAQLEEGATATASATEHPLSDDSVDAVVTDPPYYAAIPYADLSDFFYSWLKRSIGHLHPNLFQAALSPKDEECVSLSHRAEMYRQKDGQWFEQMMARACAECRRITKPSGIGVFVFANKETAGWEAMLGALVSAGWTITASWPIDTEMGNRLRAQNSAVLASSIHLVCRPREGRPGSQKTGDTGDWRDILQELPSRIHDWMPRLAEEGVVGADAIFACLGPALEIFSRYARVEKASGEVVTLKDYLQEVWAAVSREALSMIFKGADASGFEEDARLTAMWLWTLQTESESGTGAARDEGDEGSKSKSRSLPGYSLEFDAARKIAQGLGAYLENLEHLVEVKGESAILLSAAARTKYLFGDAGVTAARGRQKKKAQIALELGEGENEVQDVGGAAGELKGRPGATVLDRIHQAMILFGAGRGEAVRHFLVDEGVGRNPMFWRLAQALSALYPVGSEEKRWVDGVLARKKGLGF